MKVKHKKKIILFIIFTLLLQLFPFQMPKVAHAEPRIKTKIIVGVFKYWKDPSNGKWYYDDPLSNGQRKVLQSPIGEVKYYPMDFRVDDGYIIKDIQMYKSPSSSYTNPDTR